MPKMSRGRSQSGRSPHARLRNAGLASVSLLALSLALAGAPQGAHALPAVVRSLGATQPPSHANVDERGVNLATGEYLHPRQSVSIGPAGRGGLTQAFFGRVYQDNFTGSLKKDTGVFYVSLGEVTDELPNDDTCGSVFCSRQGTGAELYFDYDRNVYVYTQADGTVATFVDGPSPGPNFSPEHGRISQITHPDGETLTYHYRLLPFGPRIRAVTNNFGYQIRYEYDDSNGPSTTVQHVRAINGAQVLCDPEAESCGDLSGWPSLAFSDTSVTDSAGQVTATSDPAPNTLQVTYPGNRVVTVSFDGQGRVASVQTAAGTWGYLYEVDTTRVDQPVKTTVTAPDNSQKVIYGYAKSGIVYSRCDESGSCTGYAHDANGRLDHVTTPRGRVIKYNYGPRDNLKSIVASPLADQPADPITVMRADYDADCMNHVICNKPTATYDALGHKTAYEYDPVHGGLTKVTLPADDRGVSAQSRYAYAQLSGQILTASGYSTMSPVAMLTDTSACATMNACAGQKDELRTHLGYASANLLPTDVTTSNGLGQELATTSFGFDYVGNATSVDGPLTGSADTTHMRYDGDRRLVGVIDPDPANGEPRRARRYSYNQAGDVGTVSLGTVSGLSDGDWALFSSQADFATEYDGAGRKVTDTVSRFGQTPVSYVQYSYDLRNRLHCTAVRMNPSAFGSTGDACVLGPDGAYGPDRVTAYAYDPASRLDEIVQAFGGQPPAGSPPRTLSETRTLRHLNFDPDGQLSSEQDARGGLTSYAPDGFGRVKAIYYPDKLNFGVSSNTDVETFTYDPSGAVTNKALRGGGQIAIGYDALGRIDSRDADSAQFTYDTAGRILTASAAGSSYGNTYDSRGNLLSQTDQANRTVSYEYDEANRRTRMTWPDGFFVTYDYDAAGRLLAIRENGGTALTSFGYDLRNERNSMTRPNGVTTSYDHDAAGALSSLGHTGANGAGGVSWSFQRNPTEQTVTRTNSNSAYGPATFPSSTNYDRNFLNQYTSVNGQALQYNARGDLTADGSAGSNPSHAYDLLDRVQAAHGVGLTYDAFGRVIGVSAAHFTYDGDDLIAEYDASNNLVHRYVHGPSVDEPLVEYDAAGTKRWLLADERGSVVGAADGAGVTTATGYDDYGRGAPVSRFGFTGQAWFGEAGLYHFKARAYSPALGRFYQTDPAANGAAASLYEYVGNDPINATDPTGRFSLFACSNLSSGGGLQPDGALEIVGHRSSCTTVDLPDPTIVFGQSAEPFATHFGSGGAGVSPPPSPQNDQHQYDNTYKVCKQGGNCTTQEVYKCLTENPAPGVSGPPVQNGQTGNVLGLGPVSFTVSPGTMTVVNSTLTNHTLYPGYVIRSVVTDSSGNIGVSNSGYGTGRLGALNTALAPWVWSWQTTLQISSCVAAGK